MSAMDGEAQGTALHAKKIVVILSYYVNVLDSTSVGKHASSKMIVDKTR